jgi:hypothetical protein
LVRLLLYHPAARSHDGGGYPTSMGQRLIRSIDNRVDRLAGYVPLDDEHVGFPNRVMSDDVHGSRLRVAADPMFEIVPFRVWRVVCVGWRLPIQKDIDIPDNPTPEPGDGRLVGGDPGA